MTPDLSVTTLTERENGGSMNVATSFMKSNEILSDHAALVDNRFFK